MAQPAPTVILISSHVARGSVGNRIMSFALERLGMTVWEVPTIILPHHPGQAPADRIVPEDDAFSQLLGSIAERSDGLVDAIRAGDGVVIAGGMDETANALLFQLQWTEGP